MRNRLTIGREQRAIAASGPGWLELRVQLDGTITAAGAQIEALLGHDAGRLRGLPLPDLLTERGREAFDRLLILASGGARDERVDLEFRAAEGQTLTGCFSALPEFERGQLCELILRGTDKTDARAAEAALEASEERFRRLLSSTAEAVLLVNRAGLVVAANANTASLLGYTPQELAGQEIDPQRRLAASDGSPLSGAADPVAECLRTGRGTACSPAVVHWLDGATRWVTLHVTPLPEGGHPEVAAMVVVRDVTQLMAAPPRAGEQPAELDQFAGDLAAIQRLEAGAYATIEEFYGDCLRTGARLLGLEDAAVFRWQRDRLAQAASLSGRAAAPAAAVAQLGLLLTHRERREEGSGAVWIEAPLLDGERLLGTLRFCSPQGDTAREFTARERGLVELLASAMVRSAALRRQARAGMLAELLEHDRSRAMQMLSRSAPLDEILAHVTRMIERQRPETLAAVLLLEDGRLRAAAAPALPDEYRQALAGTALASAPRLAALAAGQPGWALLEAGELPPFMKQPTLAARLELKEALVERVALDRGRALGFLALHAPAGQLQPDEDRGLLEIAAPLVAIAVDRHEMNGRLEYQSKHDALTGLIRHGAFQREVAAAIERRGAQRQAAVLVLDLDRFRQVNDSLGLAAGDKALVEVARRIREAAPPGSVAARSGGDEFAVLLTELESEAEALHAAETILRSLRLPVRAGEHDLLLTASAGLSSAPKDGDDAGLLLRRAGAAMLRVKARGKNDLQQFHPAMGESAAEQMRLETALRQALARDELSLRFQPQFYLDGRLDGFEVLLTWRHPALGRVAPTRFIPIAEEIGLIGELGGWVLRSACQEAAGWRRRGCAPVRIAVNVSPLQFAQPDFLEMVGCTLREAGLDGSALELEITESVILRDFDEAARSLARLRALGVTISIDDFGVGYSSLNYLRQLPLDAVKIDRSFVEQLTKPNGSLPLIHTITILAHNLGLKVIAEGVEQMAEMRMLELARCDKVQGFLCGEPVDAAEVLRRLTAPGGYPVPECARQKVPGW